MFPIETTILNEKPKNNLSDVPVSSVKEVMLKKYYKDCVDYEYNTFILTSECITLKNEIQKLYETDSIKYSKNNTIDF